MALDISEIYRGTVKKPELGETEPHIINGELISINYNGTRTLTTMLGSLRNLYYFYDSTEKISRIVHLDKDCKVNVLDPEGDVFSLIKKLVELNRSTLRQCARFPEDLSHIDLEIKGFGLKLRLDRFRDQSKTLESDNRVVWYKTNVNGLPIYVEGVFGIDVKNRRQLISLEQIGGKEG